MRNSCSVARDKHSECLTVGNSTKYPAIHFDRSVATRLTISASGALPPALQPSEVCHRPTPRVLALDITNDLSTVFPTPPSMMPGISVFASAKSCAAQAMSQLFHRMKVEGDNEHECL